MLFPLCLSQSDLSPVEALRDFCLEQAEGGSAAFGVLRHQVPGRCCQQQGAEVTGTSLLPSPSFWTWKVRASGAWFLLCKGREV